jgi:hypothetical protein
MTAFSPGKPVTTDTPTVTVDPLPAGRHTFTLVVVDDAGARSAPATAVVTVAER